MLGTSMEVTGAEEVHLGPSVRKKFIFLIYFFCETAPEVMENPGYCSGSFDGLHPSDDDDDDELVDIAGATLDFSTTDDVPPLSSGEQGSRTPR